MSEWERYQTRDHLGQSTCAVWTEPPGTWDEKHTVDIKFEKIYSMKKYYYLPLLGFAIACGGDTTNNSEAETETTSEQIESNPAFALI